MSADFAAVLDLLPAEGLHIRQRLGWTHEKTYRTLVRLYDRGLVRLMPRDSVKHGGHRRIWETADDND